MPALKTYDLFNSHAWKYSDDYNRVVQFLDAANNFIWRNYSVPVDKRFAAMSEKELVAELDGQIRPVNAVLVLSGMYAAYSGWIETEIGIANKYGKPIIGVKPWGQERVPQIVTSNAKIVVGWNTASIVQAIRDYAL